MGSVLSQFFRVPAASLTETNCPDQHGRVFIVTGGYGGVGLELCRILYAHNATVYIAGRSESKASSAIASMKELFPKSTGSLDFLSMDLSNLATIKPAVEAFRKKSDRLDVLVNNAAVMFPPQGSLDSHGNDLQIGTNNLGPFLLYKLLSPILSETAASAKEKGSVRVLWAASVAVHVACPQPDGMVLDEQGRPKDKGPEPNYGQSKVGNVFFARHFAVEDTPKTGVVHVAFNPGNLRTDLQRHWKGLKYYITFNYLCHPAIKGAYTELWAAISPEITAESSGMYVFPWGRKGNLPSNIENACKTSATANGSTASPLRFVDLLGEFLVGFIVPPGYVAFDHGIALMSAYRRKDVSVGKFVVTE